MLRNMRCLLLLLLLLGGAAAGGCIPKEIPPPLVERVPYKILVHYSSDLPSPYYVLSGPFQSYQRFAVNESFQRRLEVYAAAKSTPSATLTLELGVHVKELLTTYDRLGILPEDQAYRLAVAGVGWPGDWPLSAFDSHTRDRFDDLPEQITKTAILQTQVTIKLPDQRTVPKEIIGRSIHILEREDMGLRTHDYSPLIAEVQTAAMVEIDRLLDQTLRQDPGPALRE